MKDGDQSISNIVCFFLILELIPPLKSAGKLDHSKKDGPEKQSHGKVVEPVAIIVDEVQILNSLNLIKDQIL